MTPLPKIFANALVLASLWLPAVAIAQEDLNYNESQNIGESEGNSSAPATRNMEAEGYTLDSEQQEKKEYERDEIRAMKYAQDYSLKFTQEYSIDEAMRNSTVYARARPEYQAQNIRLGSFFLAPQIGVAETFNDNIYATATNEREDFITRVKPVVLLRSDWSRHAIAAGVSYDAGLYQDYADENFIDSTYSLNGQLDVVQDSYISGGLLVQQKHEDRATPEDVNGTEPTKYALTTANLEFYRKVSRVLLKMAVEGRRFDYATTPGAFGAEIDSGDRDRYEYVASTRVAYEFKPGYQAFMDVAYNMRDYVRDSVGDIRNSQGYRINAGTSIDISGQTKGELYAGYLSQDYESSTLDDVSAVNYGASLLWNVTRLTSVQFEANRTLSETTFASSSGFITTLADISVEHELRRNILFNTGFTYALNEYEGIDRTDNIYSLSLGARYLISPNFSLNFDYNYQMRETDAVGSDFERNRVMLSLKAEL